MGTRDIAAVFESRDYIHRCAATIYFILGTTHALEHASITTLLDCSVQMDSDVGMDDLALSVYFAKPFTTVRVPRRGGGYIISRKPVEDPELENDEAVRAKLMEEGMAAPKNVRLLRTGSMLPGVQPHFHGGSTLMPAGGPGDRVARVQLSTTGTFRRLGLRCHFSP